MYRFARTVLANHRRLGNLRSQVEFSPKFPKFEPSTKVFLLSGTIAAFFGQQNEEEKESDLIMAIKRGLWLWMAFLRRIMSDIAI